MIEIINKTDFRIDDYNSHIERVCLITLESESFPNKSAVSVAIVDNAEIRALNNKYRKIASETDVLSFPACAFSPGEYGEPDEGEVFLGDIVISIEKAEAQSEEYGHSLLRELAFLTAHSMLHLLGYDHLSARDEALMIDKQEHILVKAGIKRQ